MLGNICVPLANRRQNLIQRNVSPRSFGSQRQHCAGSHDNSQRQMIRRMAHSDREIPLTGGGRSSRYLPSMEFSGIRAASKPKVVTP